MIRLEACLTGRLANAYPVAANDIEIQATDVPAHELSAVLRAASDAVLTENPKCRKVIFAAPRGHLGAIRAAESAGFRYVVDVDLPEPGGSVELSLLVREPDHVTRVDMDLDRVPDR